MKTIFNKNVLILAFMLSGISFIPIGTVFSSIIGNSGDEYCETCTGSGYKHHHHHGYYCNSSADADQKPLNQITNPTNAGEIKSIQFLYDPNDESTEKKARHYHHYC